jgi:uncharacterized protein (DUF58 family)
MKELLTKLRKYEIRMRKAITAHMQGDFHSVFKGSGLEFDDVRPYQYGDDVRHIDWNVSAKGHGPFVKTYKEEKEQSIFFLLDVSASLDVGRSGRKKLDVSREIAGVLALSGVKESSSIGLLCFTDRKEKYIAPGKGVRHGYHIINSLFKLEASSKKTNLQKGIFQAMGLLKRKSVLVLISDFVDDSAYEKPLKALAHRHDLIVIQVGDKRESRFPSLGIVPLHDKESGRTLWTNTSSGQFRAKIDAYYNSTRTRLQKLCTTNNASYLYVSTTDDFVPKLIRLFKVRQRIRK